MNKYLYAFMMSQSMFCAIPCPWKIWNDEARYLMLLFLSVIGLEIGALWIGLACLLELLNLPPMVTGLGLCTYPYLITGHLHLDGFMDVTDAVKSYRNLVCKSEILKDSHVGSLAVIDSYCFCWQALPYFPLGTETFGF